MLPSSSNILLHCFTKAPPPKKKKIGKLGSHEIRSEQQNTYRVQFLIKFRRIRERKKITSWWHFRTHAFSTTSHPQVNFSAHKKCISDFQLRQISTKSRHAPRFSKTWQFWQYIISDPLNWHTDILHKKAGVKWAFANMAPIVQFLTDRAFLSFSFMCVSS